MRKTVIALTALLLFHPWVAFGADNSAEAVPIPQSAPIQIQKDDPDFKLPPGTDPALNTFPKFIGRKEGVGVTLMDSGEVKRAKVVDTGPGRASATPSINWSITKDPACAEDIKALCGKVEPGSGRVFGCLSTNIDRIKSEFCKSKMQVLVVHFKNIIDACGKDISSMCKSDKSISVLQCLNKNRDSLSNECFDEFDDKARYEKLIREHARSISNVPTPTRVPIDNNAPKPVIPGAKGVEKQS